MTLGFTQTINKKKNYFIEKIWEGLMDHKLTDEGFEYIEYFDAYKLKFGNIWDGGDGAVRDKFKPKIHTIRADPSNRWKAGMNIHMVINNRTKNRFQFAPVLKCVSVQEIKIEYKDHRFAQDPNYRYCVLKIDGISKSREEVTELAINDGFDSVEDFFAYFNKDFTGRLIHWTNLKY